MFSSGTEYSKVVAIDNIESPDIMDATVIIVFGCSDNFRLFYCVFAIKKTCIFVSDGAILCFYMYPY